jgi:hypothetical protein
MASESPNPANPETQNPVTPEVVPAGAIEPSSTPPSPETAQAWLEKSERFVKLVAENLRYGSWTKRFVTIGGVAFVAFNPMTAGKVAEVFGVRELPKWYLPAFGVGMGGLAIGAVVTLPRRTLEHRYDSEAVENRLILSQDLEVGNQKFIKHS